MRLSEKAQKNLNRKKGIKQFLLQKDTSVSKVLRNLNFEDRLKKLQVELIHLQHWVVENNEKVVVIFEGRDAAGKGGAIRRITQHLNPREFRVVALPKPTEEEKGQWYFQRYINQLPRRGKMVFFDRSWYNRAVVEPVMGFCSKEQYEKFILQVPNFEHLLYEDNLKIIKYWFSISRSEQKQRFDARLHSPLKRWKFSPVDHEGQKRWDDYTFYKEQMYSKSHTTFSPWLIIKTHNKKQARLESIKYVLSLFDYQNKGEICKNLLPDPNIVQRYFRNTIQLDQ